MILRVLTLMKAGNRWCSFGPDRSLTPLLLFVYSSRIDVESNGCIDRSSPPKIYKQKTEVKKNASNSSGAIRKKFCTGLKTKRNCDRNLLRIVLNKYENLWE